MSPEELHRYEGVLRGESLPDFSDEEVSRWEAMLSERNAALDARVDAAISKSMEQCKAPKVKQS